MIQYAVLLSVAHMNPFTTDHPLQSAVKVHPVYHYFGQLLAVTLAILVVSAFAASWISDTIDENSSDIDLWTDYILIAIALPGLIPGGFLFTGASSDLAIISIFVLDSFFWAFVIVSSFWMLRRYFRKKRTSIISPSA